MREFPVFVPFEEDHLAAVITTPDDDPAGLVLLLTGTGAPRSHRFQVWTRVARRLASHGLASVRLDYRGIGDSTGGVRQLGRGHSLRGALEVARFAQKAVGVDRVATAGNCTGAVTALAVAAETPECIGSYCMLTRILDPSAVNRLVIGARRSRVAGFVRRHPLISRLAQPLRGRKGKPSSSVEGTFHQALQHGRLFFLYSEDDRDSYNEKSMAYLQTMLSRHPPEERARFEIEVVTGALSGFDSLEVQEDVVERVVEWLKGCFELGPEPLRPSGVPSRG